MICILSINEEKEITGWIIATDLRDAFQQATGASIGGGEESPAGRLAVWLLSRQNIVPARGKHELSSGHIMLVS